MEIEHPRRLRQLCVCWFLAALEYQKWDITLVKQKTERQSGWTTADNGNSWL
jgi:hypothetical protein